MNKSEIDSSVSDEVSNVDRQDEDERLKETISTSIQQFNSQNFIFLVRTPAAHTAAQTAPLK
jgi:hypothetical protein